MSRFSEMLSSFAKKSAINSPQIAAYCGLDRVTVYRFLKGKTLPGDKEVIGKLAEILRLTDDEKNSLIQAYEIAKVGDQTYWNRQNILSFIKSFNGKNKVYPTFQYDVDDLEVPVEDTILLRDRDEVLQRIQKEIMSECLEREEPRIDLVMRLGTMKVMDMLYFFGRKYKKMSIRHLIPLPVAATAPEEGWGQGQPRMSLDPAGASREDTGRSWDKGLLQSFFEVTVICAAGVNYAPFYHYVQQTGCGHFPVYSNLLVTGGAAILFSDDLESAVLFHKQDHVAYFSGEFSKKLEGKPSMVNYYEDAVDFMACIKDAFVEKGGEAKAVLYTYMSLPCLIPVLTNEIMEKHILLDALPGEARSDLLGSIYDYVDSIRKEYVSGAKDYNLLIAESGFRKFLETGRFGEVPLELYSPLTPEERRQMVRAVADHPDLHTHILKKELSAPEGFLSIETLENNLFIEFLTPDKRMCYIIAREPGILLAFKDFMKNQLEENCLPEEESREIIRKLADEI